VHLYIGRAGSPHINRVIHTPRPRMARARGVHCLCRWKLSEHSDVKEHVVAPIYTSPELVSNLRFIARRQSLEVCSGSGDTHTGNFSNLLRYRAKGLYGSIPTQWGYLFFPSRNLEFLAKIDARVGGTPPAGRGGIPTRWVIHTSITQKRPPVLLYTRLEGLTTLQTVIF